MSETNIYGIGKRIGFCRIRAGLSQGELATMLGYKSRSTINKIEAGINGISGYKLMNMARALHTSVDYLTGVTDDPSCPVEEKATQDAIHITKNAMPKEKIALLLKIANMGIEDDIYKAISLLANYGDEFGENQKAGVRGFIETVKCNNDLKKAIKMSAVSKVTKRHSTYRH